MTMQSWMRRTTMKYLAFLVLSNDFDFLGGTNTWPHSSIIVSKINVLTIFNLSETFGLLPNRYLIFLYPNLNQRIFIFERILDTNYFD